VYIGIYLVPIIYSFIRFHKIYQDKQSEAIALFVNITFFNIAIAAFNLIYSFSHPLAILYFFDQEPKSAVLAILVMILILIACFFIAFKLIIYLNSKDKEAQIKKNKQIKINYLVPRLKQNGLNCGPFALAQVLQYYGEIITAEELIQGTKMVQGIGTYESNLALTAKKLGYKTKITTQNLYLFDPTWQELSQNELIVKLQEQEKELKDKDLTQSAQGFIEYLQAGGKLGSETIDRDLLVDKLGRGPLVVGLNMTYLYQEKRPLDKEAKRYGHFVTVSGYDGENDTFTLIDPWHSIPFSKDGIYQVKSARLIAAIYLAEATFDASLLEVYQ
jgi:predicted double-glycine peptidase